MNSKLAVVTLWMLTLSLSAAQTHPVRASKAESPPPSPPKVTFVDIAERTGLTAKTEDGGDKTKRYIIETTGSGAAAFDFDNDGWPDIFLVNGNRLEGFPKGQEPTSHLYRNNRDGTFADVTQKAGAGLVGWGQGVCAGDYDNDGFVDLFVTFWGHDVLLHNNATAPSPTSRARLACGTTTSAGPPAAFFWITTATAVSISSSPTTST